jgi:hypothetical protein
MSATHHPGWAGDPAADRLFSVVRDACVPERDLPARLAAGLRAALGMLAAEPDLAYELTVAPWLESDDGALDAQRDWMTRFGDLLLDAAADDPRTTPSRLPFLATFLIGGVRFQIGRLVLNGEATDLLRILPGTLEALLAYYFEPGEPRALAAAALAGR